MPDDLWWWISGLTCGVTVVTTWREVRFWLRYRYWKRPDRIVVACGFLLFALFAATAGATP